MLSQTEKISSESVPNPLKFSERSIQYKIALFYLIVMGVQFVHIEGFGPSLLKAAAMIISPVLFLASKAKFSVAWIAGGTYFVLILVSLAMRSLPITLTVGYTFGCLCMFAAYHSQLVSGAFTREDALKILKGFIYVYWGVLLLQQIKGFTGIGYAPIINYWRIAYEGTLKFNSLFIEPSHFGRVMAVALFAYLELKRLEYGSKLSLKKLWATDKWVLIAGVYSLISSGSGAAIIAFGVIVGYVFLRGGPGFIIFSLIVMLAVSPFLKELNQVERATSVIKASMTMDMRKVDKADHSAAARVGVFFSAIENFRPMAWDYWIGQTPGSRDYHSNIGIVELYGAAAYLGMLFLLFSCCFRSIVSVEFVFFCGMFAATVGNVAYVWFSMMIYAIVKYFYDQYDSPESKRKRLLNK